ncbi:MAG TPA: glycoside hydrolase family 2 TIM barrel-domain containing protein [bacterium]|nr:glycoside hydrolase family 2 TIM barrel-domain containing protein [bacterium]
MRFLLNGVWRGRPDPELEGIKEKWFADGSGAWAEKSCMDTRVPVCWNSIQGFDNYEGCFWYARDFDLPDDREPFQTEFFIRFLAVNYMSKAWLNGHELGSHEGGYLPFEFPLPEDVLKSEGNRLVVMVENVRSPKRIPGELCDWFNYGGILRDVELHARSRRRFDSVRVSPVLDAGAAGIKVDYRQTEKFGFKWIVRRGEDVVTEGAEDEPGGVLEIDIPDAVLWHPDHPELYTIEMIPGDGTCADGACERFGLRDIKVEGTKILLNGQPVKLQGVSLHEEQVPDGRCLTREQRFEDVRAIKKLGFNALRTAHYSHDEALMDAADEIGLLILEEIPVYWDLDYGAPELFETASSMLTDLVRRDYNHPSVILWSVGNEVPVEDPACDIFIRKLMKLVREMDSTRIVTYVSCRFMIDKTRKQSDVCCVNCYIGWYFGKREMMSDALEMARTTAPDKPWMMTEFGAGAKFGFRGGKNTKFTEDFQADFLSDYIKILNGKDWVAGWFIWIYRDFRSPIRMNRYQKGFNRKGIVSESNEQKQICGRFPALLKEKSKTSPPRNVEIKAKIAEVFERSMYMIIQPNLAKQQRGQYNRFYKRKPGTSR